MVHNPQVRVEALNCLVVALGLESLFRKGIQTGEISVWAPSKLSLICWKSFLKTVPSTTYSIISMSFRPIERGRQEIAQGKKLSHEDVKRELKAKGQSSAK